MRSARPSPGLNGNLDRYDRGGPLASRVAAIRRKLEPLGTQEQKYLKAYEGRIAIIGSFADPTQDEPSGAERFAVRTAMKLWKADIVPGKGAVGIAPMVSEADWPEERRTLMASAVLLGAAIEALTLKQTRAIVYDAESNPLIVPTISASAKQPANPRSLLTNALDELQKNVLPPGHNRLSPMERQHVGLIAIGHSGYVNQIFHNHGMNDAALMDGGLVLSRVGDSPENHRWVPTGQYPSSPMQRN